MPHHQGRKEDSMFWKLAREAEQVRWGVTAEAGHRVQVWGCSQWAGLPVSLSGAESQ